ncbi:hypothetical protein [Nocardia sp. NPDC057668]|uniref:DUF7373 family lipoprotein n=1 Tax=Nocardia sp. NPDC057668 TaxID=3346202 RepID=UPI003672DA9C
MSRFVRSVVAAAMALTLGGAAACGSDGGSGGAEPDIDLTTLDVGSLPTEPVTYDRVTSIEQAKAVEGMRLANVVPLPSEIIPEVSVPAQIASVAVRTFIDFSSRAIKIRTTAAPAELNAAAPGFVVGFVSSGKSNDEYPALSYEYENIVLLFEDDAAATSAAQALGRLDFESVAGSEPVELAKYPGAIVHAEGGDTKGLIKSWYATGKFVVFTYVWDNLMAEAKTRDLGKLTARVERALDVIPPALTSFRATPKDQLMNLPVDPDNILGRTLSTTKLDSAQVGSPGVFDAHGGLHIVQGTDSAALLERTGVDRVAWNGGYLYRARDADAAAEIVTEYSSTTRLFKRADSPENLPNAQCRKYSGPGAADIPYYCYVSHGRYAAQVSALQLKDAQQRIAAQYAILVNAH